MNWSSFPTNCARTVEFSSVQSLSCVRFFATPWTVAHQASLSITNSRHVPKHVHWVGDAIQPSYPLLSPSTPTFNLSQHQGLFKWVSPSHQVAKVLKFQLQHQSFQSKQQPGLILRDGVKCPNSISLRLILKKDCNLVFIFKLHSAGCIHSLS